jgi:hypothetical protein
MRITSSGNVGIGTVSPSTLLHVSGNVANAFIVERSTASSNIYIQYRNATTSWYAGQTDAGTFGIGTNAALGADTRFNITTAGNVGLGTTSPGARLDVRAQGALSTDIAFRVRNSADTANLIQVNGAGGIEINSTTQGVLFPRMTTTQKNAIVSPASGLVIYDTTLNKLCVRGASAWETITSI